ncbi:hypothetical protein [Bacillus horti]|uniref:Integrase n=1 Tax=Caldalkalibacillus horti TaxID=77523 RepID=A0ABT9VXJ3_9BACI|nr:hypothetical protein [Bacillus horti]MDQ0165706.1 integrase [Bacillus horti]
MKVLIERFLNHQEIEGFVKGKSQTTYERKLEIFRMYIEERMNVSKEGVLVYLNGMGIEDIKKSMLYYIDLIGIKHEDTMRLYVSVVREFMRYLYKYKYIQNPILINSIGLTKKDENSFNFVIDKYIFELLESKQLKFSLSKTPISAKEFFELLQACDNTINTTDHSILYGKGKYYGDYTNFVAALMTKFIMFTGIKVSIIYSIKSKDYIMELNKIRINNYWIRLPDNYALQLKKYHSIVGNLLSEDGNLFVNYDGSSIDNNNSIGAFIKNSLVESKSFSTSRVSKYAIIELMKVGISSQIIKEFTGNKDTIIRYCSDKVDEEMLDIKNRLIDSKIRSLDFIDNF